MTPDQLVALQQADKQFEVRCLELQMEDRANTREAVKQSEKYAALVDYVGRQVISRNLFYVIGIVLLQIIALVLAIKYLPSEAALIVGVVGNLAGVIIAGLLKERQEVVSLLFGAKPNSGPMLEPGKFRIPPPPDIEEGKQEKLL